MRAISKGFGIFGLMVIGLMSAGLSYSQIALDDVVARWDFDKGDGTQDSVGGHNGELTGDPKLVDGKFNKAMSFDGKSFMKVDPEPFKFNEPQNFSSRCGLKSMYALDGSESLTAGVGEVTFSVSLQVTADSN